MHVYMGYSKSVGSREGAVLVFAHNPKEAIALAQPILTSWFGNPPDATVKLLQNPEYFLETEADPEKLAQDIGHVKESPACCSDCGFWGLPLNSNGHCENCSDGETDDDEGTYEEADK